VTTWTPSIGYPSGSGVVGATYQVGLDWQVAGVGDFNGDGLSDVLWRNTNGAVEIWNAQSGPSGLSFMDTAPMGLSPHWQVAGVGDFNGSGCDGILWRNVNSGDVTTWNSTAAAPESFANNGGATYHVGADWQVAGVGDFNGDGHADILWRNTNGDIQLWLENGGPGPVSFTAQAAQAVGLDWKVIQIGDFNGDGLADIVWRNSTSNDVMVWEAQAGGAVSFVTKDLGLAAPDWQVAVKPA